MEFHNEDIEPRKIRRRLNKKYTLRIVYRKHPTLVVGPFEQEEHVTQAIVALLQNPILSDVTNLEIETELQPVGPSGS